MTITNGYARFNSGGGLENYGTATLTDGTISGNSQGNILIGGPGNNTITGGSGRSILIAGKGAARSPAAPAMTS
jgi:hypothetical protein